ncbi:MAG: O-antigen polymerase [Ignavibacteriaceae bacterium]
MFAFLIIVFGIIGILLSKYYFGKWFNHLSMYTAIWMSMLFLFELRFIRYYDLSVETWLVILAAYLGFISGIACIFLARSVFQKDNKISITPTLRSNLLIYDAKYLRLIIWLFIIVGLLSALQHWKVLFDEYGSISNIIIEAHKIYRDRVEGEQQGVIPYVWLTIYIAIFLGGIYTAYKNKLTITAILPIVALLIKEIANFSRAGILVGLFTFIISYTLFRHFLTLQDGNKTDTFKLKNVVAFILIFSLLALGASLVKFLRNPVDEMKGATSSLTKYETGFIISPQIYLYASAHIGVLNKHLEEEARAELIGSKTISPIYRFLGSFDIVNKPRYHQKGYFIPQWTNTGTYLRDIHGDFGYLGVFIIPFLIGLFSTYYWFKFFEGGKIIDHIILTYLYLLIAMSFLLWVSSFPSWMVVFLVLLILIPFLEKIFYRSL